MTSAQQFNDSASALNKRIVDFIDKDPEQDMVVLVAVLMRLAAGTCVIMNMTNTHAMTGFKLALSEARNTMVPEGAVQ